MPLNDIDELIALEGAMPRKGRSGISLLGLVVPPNWYIAAIHIPETPAI